MLNREKYVKQWEELLLINDPKEFYAKYANYLKDTGCYSSARIKLHEMALKVVNDDD